MSKPIPYEDLERRFDGPIPPRLLSGKSERELMIDHHRVMIRFSAVRIIDFTESLARLKAGPRTPGTAAWIARTEAIIADHEAEKTRHHADLAALLAAVNAPG